MDYTSDPHKTNDYTFTPYETNLLASKSSYVSVMLYEQIKVNSDQGPYIKEIQPCMYFYDEQIEAFSQGMYTIVIDSTRNTPAFRNEVNQMKEQGMYEKGVF